MGTTGINVMQNTDLLIGCYPINGPMASGYIFFYLGTSGLTALGKKIYPSVIGGYVEDTDLLRGCYPYQWTCGRGLYFFYRGPNGPR